MLGVIFLALCISLGHSAKWIDCENTMFYDYDRMKPNRERPRCISNCSYTYVKDGETQYMPCSMEACRDFESSDEAPICPEISNVSFLKFRRKHKTMTALMLEWSATDFNMLKFPDGYCLQINDAMKSYSRCYYFSQTDWTNRLDIFKNDCFLPSQSKGKPLYPIKIAISSLPLKFGAVFKTRRSIFIKVPSRGSGFVEKKVCENFSVKYRYNIDPDFGSEVTVSTCQLDMHGNCEGKKKILQTNLNVTGTLHNLTFPSTLNHNASHRIFLHGESGDPLNFTTFSFQECLLENQSVSESYIRVAATVAAIGVMLIFVILLLLCRKWRVKQKVKSRGYAEVITLNSTSSSSSNNPTETISLSASLGEEVSEVKESDDEHTDDTMNDPSIFVLFTDDNEHHTHTVSAFCKYLRRGLALRVEVSLWDIEGEYAANPNRYITNHLHKADKILLICSARTRNCLHLQSDTSERDIVEFTFGVNHALAEIKSTKFLVCYFSYSTEECIPLELAGVYCNHYKLLDNMKQLYLHIKECEEYTKDGKNSWKELEGKSDSEVVQGLWNDLEESIERAKNLTAGVSNHPKDSHCHDEERDTNKVRVTVHQPPTDEFTSHSSLLPDNVIFPADQMEILGTYQGNLPDRAGVPLSENVVSTDRANLHTSHINPVDAFVSENHTNMEQNDLRPSLLQRSRKGAETEVRAGLSRPAKTQQVLQLSDMELIERAFQLVRPVANNGTRLSNFSSLRSDESHVVHPPPMNGLIVPESDLFLQRSRELSFPPVEVSATGYQSEETVPKSVYDDEIPESHAWNPSNYVENLDTGFGDFGADSHLSNSCAEMEVIENGQSGVEQSDVSLEVACFLMKHVRHKPQA